MSTSRCIGKGIAFGCAVAILHMLLHSTVDYSLQAGTNALTFIVILCLVIITAHLPHPKRRHSQDS